MKWYRVLLVLLFFIGPFDGIKGQVVIQMEEDSGVYKVPCKINGLKLKFIFDTGASSICLSGAVADMMLENGYLDKKDIVGKGKSSVADGRIVDHTIINIKEIEIGGLTLKDVEAVVIHQQSAPLLLGQSAIQKLGKISISGNQLIISSYGATNPYLTQLPYSKLELAVIYQEADRYYRNKYFDLAVEKYDIIYKAGKMYLDDILKYALSLRACSNPRYEDALYVLLKNEKDVLDSGSESQYLYYDAICSTAYWAKEYNISTRYGELTKVYAQGQACYPLQERWDTVYWIASSHKEAGRYYQAKNEVNTFIADYLKFMEIKATDCWDKDYCDAFLGDLYVSLAFVSGDTYAEGEKYFIIAAAWGNKDAIEICNEYGFKYDNKPANYVY